MELYLLKSAACLTLFFVFYKLVLENTSIHTFKRFFLFGSLLASFLIPLITFTSYVEISPIVPIYAETTQQITYPKIENSVNYWPLFLWTLYGLGVLFFSLKFFRNLFNLIKQIRKNPKYQHRNFIHVLLSEAIIPHTFFNYIFLNKKQFENREIPQEVIFHEETHARQKHSLDIIFVELLQIVFWFNPLFHFIKKSIKLNHEFLADRAVLNAGAKTSDYQKILLAFSSPDSYRDAATPSLAHSLNYSSIKKRFTLMKTRTSKRAIWIKSLLILPLFSVLIYGFSTNKVVQKTKATTELTHQKADAEVFPESSQMTSRNLDIQILENGTYNINGLVATKQTFVKTVKNFHQDISPAIRNKILNIHVKSNTDIPSEEVKFIFDSLQEYGFYRMVTPNQEIVLGKGNTPLASNDVTEATKAEIAEYNKLAKKYNAVDIEERIIKKKDLERLEIIYKKMTLAQRAKAQPFPECNQKQNYSREEDNKKFSEANYYYKGERITFEKANELLDKNNNIGIYISKEENTVHLYEEPFDKKKIAIKDNQRMPSAENGNLYMAPEAPPAPIADPVEYVKELGKRGATFYIGPHKYSTDEAIEMVKKSTNDVSIDVSQYPIVHLGGC